MSDARSTPRASTPFTARATSCTASASTCDEGQIITLLGRNGAGKTTTLRSLIGLTPPREGSIEIFGQDTTRWPPYRIAALGVGYVPEGRRIFANLTVEENLRVPMERPRPVDDERVFELFPRLAERRDSNRGRQLSGGEQEMLAIARALILNPRLLILDEPSQGLAPLIVREVFDVVARVRAEGISVLLVEQNVRLRSRSPTAPMCSTTAASSIRVRPPNSARTRIGCAPWPAPAPKPGPTPKCRNAVTPTDNSASPNPSRRDPAGDPAGP